MKTRPAQTQSELDFLTSTVRLSRVFDPSPKRAASTETLHPAASLDRKLQFDVDAEQETNYQFHNEHHIYTFVPQQDSTFSVISKQG